MLAISQTIFLFFFPACLSILKQVIFGTELTHRLLALGTFLFCIEQARMAVKDLQKIRDAKKQFTDHRLEIFYRITISTIVIELLGFYLCSVWFGWGAIVILITQIWFNLFANLKIDLDSDISLQTWKITERIAVLSADIGGLILVILWMQGIASDLIAWGLFGMVILYGSIKIMRRFKLSYISVRSS
ncbi:hypothetical protein [Calothrix sp. PCC 6303]|uniref:hypothetical protein n=1 Tax=Calothrix sp. PCC 6303 TaxID=1170562 RepID=UPI0002A057C2|nr:hypothetical protein [Calothrix sp. PCC 6303]AFZ02610.1 hypothetical protein Cal6303_3686 [Calothrix sp. PCC 6303]